MSSKVKFNKVDILIVLIVLSFLLIIGYQKFLSPGLFSSEEIQVEYVVIISQTRQVAVDHYEIGQAVFTQSTEEFIGRISAIEVKPYTEVRVYNGVGLDVVNPEFFEVHLTITGDGRVSETGVYAGESYCIASGDSVQFQTKYTRFNATIGNIKVSML